MSATGIIEQTTSQRPLITFALLAYNQQDYIREAIEGAFAQTYAPLQIVLSDDGSRDNTFHVMQEMAANYRGSHQILLNRNEPNRGIVGNVNRVMELAQGELVVVAAGDDISLPERTELTYQSWQNSHRRALSIYSKPLPFSKHGPVSWTFQARPQTHCLGYQLDNGWVSVFGACHAWHRSLFEFFGPLPDTLGEEEKSIAFRAALLGEVLFEDRAMVRYRVHEGNTSSIFGFCYGGDKLMAEKSLRERQNFLQRVHSFKLDILTAHQKSLLNRVEAIDSLQRLERCRRNREALWQLDSASMRERLRGAGALLANGNDAHLAFPEALRLLLRVCFPRFSRYMRSSAFGRATWLAFKRNAQRLARPPKLQEGLITRPT